MKIYKRNIFGYLKSVFIESWQLAFTFFDLIGIILFLYPNLADKLVKDDVITRLIGGGIFIASFLVANYKVYLDLCVDGADIRLSTQLQHFGTGSTGRNPFRDIIESPNGYTDQGLPCWATLYAQIKIANIGFEGGIFSGEIVRSRTKLPGLFNTAKMHNDLRTMMSIPERESRDVNLFIDLPFTVQDPRLFAEQLKKLSKSNKRFQVVIRYFTRRVDGVTKPRELKIKGDFADFCKEIIEHWQQHNFSELASTYES